MIRARSLRFNYPNQPLLFQDFNWSVERGETWTILGPSGCGKTSLLYLLAGLLEPEGGEIEIGGLPLKRPRPRTGLILQDFGLLPWATVGENAELGRRVWDFYGPDGTHAPTDQRSVRDNMKWLERLGISELAGKYPGQISGGQRQRTAIARTLALQPDLLLMDEPFSALDAVTREDLQALTLELCAEQGLTLVMVTHAIEEAVIMAQHILVLGHAPTRAPKTFDNPGAGSLDYRHSLEYASLCKTLRVELNREVQT
jgi:NitT/TauT family transport system ATP-binding protein